MAVKKDSIFAAISMVILSIASISTAYRPGDIVPLSRMGQYHSSRTVWHDMVGRHCPNFAVNREVLVPIPKPTGYTGADPYKITLQVGREKFLIPWLYIIDRKSSEVPMIDMHLKYSGGDLLGVTAKVVDMPHHYVELHPDIRKQFWDPHGFYQLIQTCLSDTPVSPVVSLFVSDWSLCPVMHYREERSEIDVSSGFYVLFGSGLLLSVILSINILQSSKEKVARFMRETVAENSMAGGVEKVE